MDSAGHVSPLCLSFQLGKIESRSAGSVRINPVPIQQAWESLSSYAMILRLPLALSKRLQICHLTVEETGTGLKHFLRSQSILVWSFLYICFLPYFAFYGCEGNSSSDSLKGREFLISSRRLLLARGSEELAVTLMGTWVAEPGRSRGLGVSGGRLAQAGA